MNKIVGNVVNKLMAVYTTSSIISHVRVGKEVLQVIQRRPETSNKAVYTTASVAYVGLGQ